MRAATRGSGAALLRLFAPVFSRRQVGAPRGIENGGGARNRDLSPVGVTSREREIIQLVAEGRSNKEAASTLGISVKTIEAHRANIMRKLQLRTVSELVRYAIRNKIVQP
jgi:DNA-binding NarL/FixJ family response regulator